jgi:glycosyltransferase involved in cell wall biosynthesis
LNIVLVSFAFFPSIGGVQEVSALLAREFASAGHQVVVVTKTSYSGREEAHDYRVLRRPSPLALIRLHRWADMVFHNNVSLQLGFPLLFVCRPWVVAHHIGIPTGIGLIAMKARIKRYVLRYARGVSVSRALAASFTTPCTVISNPYDDRIFTVLPGLRRDREIVFVARMIAEKGLPVLLDAIELLADRGVHPQLTVVGAGPAEREWRERVENTPIASKVRFVGVQRGANLASLLNQHRIVVVPSLCEESFGMVALEGIACGCVAIGSASGGLDEAIGPAGVTFPSGDHVALATLIEQLLANDEMRMFYREKMPEHLARHSPRKIAGLYLKLFSELLEHGKH